MVLALNKELGSFPIPVFDPRCQTSCRKLNWSSVPCFGSPKSDSGTVNSSFFGRYRYSGREVDGVMQ